MKKFLLTIALLGCGAAFAAMSPEDKSRIGSMRAKIKSKETQVQQLQAEIARMNKEVAMESSRAHVAAAERGEQKTLEEGSDYYSAPVSHKSKKYKKTRYRM